MPARFFRTAGEFRRWLEPRHRAAPELLLIFRKVGCGTPSTSWPEAVDEALCFGWIDGIRRRVDDSRYTIRFTARRPGSIWSAVNMRRVAALTAAGRMAPAGREACAARRANRSGRYSYEQRPASLVARYSRALARHRAAQRFFAAQIPSYRRAASWWVLSARRETTRLKRTQTLIELSTQGRLIPQFIRAPKSRCAIPRD